MKEQPKSRDIEKAARQHAAEILGYEPSQVLPDDIGITSFVAGAEWYKSQISRVSGEPPKRDLSELIEAWNGLDIKIELTYKGYPLAAGPPIGYVKVGRDGIVRLGKVIEKMAGIELPKQENEPTVSGEAKTPEQPIIFPKTCLDVFKNISGHLTYSETAALIQFLKEKQMPKGIELTGGSVPTPDREQIFQILNTAVVPEDGADEVMKYLRSLTVPTPSDEEIETKAKSCAYGPLVSSNDGVWYKFGFIAGAKWVKEWLRSSTEQTK